MSLPIKRIVLTAGLMMAGAGRVLACDVGDIQCDSAGYRYVCACYTSDGCQYYPSGSCTSLRSRPPEIMTRRIVDRGAGAVGPDPIPSR